ncbi:hypothetical protein ACFQXB_00250 [Plastorhodobacter daqingensis]|uniref:Flagellar protein FlgN n=1 Tax=Plastorhodobacter daqingensis TaxID=1387281 RepID=A0ABW2UD94_9RHOB
MIGFRRNPVELLADLLGEERRILLEGRLGQLADLVRRKQAALERLQAGRAPDEEVLAQLRALAQANLGLLEAAAEGVAAGQRRLAQLRSDVRGWRSYDSQGHRSAVGQVARRLEHKA